MPLKAAKFDRVCLVDVFGIPNISRELKARVRASVSVFLKMGNFREGEKNNPFPERE